MLNKVFLMGYCGKAPESKFFPSGDQIVTLSLATTKKWKDKNTNERKEKTSWHNLVFNRGLAKVAAEYITKGSKIFIEGEIDYQEWEKDGIKKNVTRILVTELQMLDSKNDGQQSTGAQQSKPTAQGAAPSTDYDEEYDEEYDDFIPF